MYISFSGLSLFVSEVFLDDDDDDDGAGTLGGDDVYDDDGAGGCGEGNGGGTLGNPGN
jgi:hypothetical protein